MIHMKDARVLVTPTSYAKNDPALRSDLEAAVGEVIYNTSGRPLSADELVEMISGFDAYIAGLDAITSDVIAAAAKLKVIARYGVGVDKVDLNAAKEKGIIVTNTPGANSSSVAELAVGLILSLARNIPAANTATRAGDWPRLRGISIEGKTVGFYGFGAIGQHLAKRLAGFDCKLMAFDPYLDQQVATELFVEALSREDIIQKSDILSLHCPVVTDTRNMVDADFLSQMKPGALIINTARGELIDEQALFEAIQSGHIAGAAMDVFRQQPPEPNNPLLGLPNVIATPHTGSHTDGATNGMGWGALNNCLAVLRGEVPPNRVI